MESWVNLNRKYDVISLSPRLSEPEIQTVTETRTNFDIGKCLPLALSSVPAKQAGFPRNRMELTAIKNPLSAGLRGFRGGSGFTLERLLVQWSDFVDRPRLLATSEFYTFTMPTCTVFCTVAAEKIALIILRVSELKKLLNPY
jgi:hypothetical protein